MKKKVNEREGKWRQGKMRGKKWKKHGGKGNDGGKKEGKLIERR